MTNTILVKAIGAGGVEARFSYGSKDQKVWASLNGQLKVHERDPEIIDRYWNSIGSALRY